MVFRCYRAEALELLKMAAAAASFCWPLLLILFI